MLSLPKRQTVRIKLIARFHEPTARFAKILPVALFSGGGSAKYSQKIRENFLTATHKTIIIKERIQKYRKSGGTSLIEIQHLTVTKRGKTVLRDACFRLANGNFYGIFDPDGSGSAALLEALAGVTVPTAGCVRVNGFDTGKEPQKAKACVGYLPLDIGFYREMTAFEFLDFCAELRKIPEGKRFRRVHTALETLDLDALRNKPVASLTLPEQRLLGLASLLATDAEILLLPDPSEGLGERSGGAVLEQLSLVTDGKTVFFVSKNRETLAGLCDGILEISNGVLSGPFDGAEWAKAGSASPSDKSNAEQEATE